ncbi:hypothetical protein RO3G_01648 [Rhizopus delemar RA 99-880]|uniref:Uncharacterized protein n=3 Tax=Rhizopus TaxID=4842 RepID=I1BL64_RHIO9|nr:hypothetical protein RO3G_01648 [Rhizopus delemar RA 99-880]|eukprot:EIE76944.1 hypothetical protein RO3G_01648 [Rhizopus delemar RA 99-880]
MRWLFCIKELNWWNKWTNFKNGLPIHKHYLKPSITIHTDASDLGWGSSFTTNTGIREMDGGRASTLYQCERVENNSIFTTTSCTVPEEGISHQDIHRQHDNVEIHDQIRRNFVHSPPINHSRYTGDMQPTPISGIIPTHTRNSKHSGRCIEPTKPAITLVRCNASKDNIQHDKQTLGSTEDRCLRFQNKQSTSKVLELTTRPNSNSNGCTVAEMVEERYVSVSPWKLIPQVIQQLLKQRIQHAVLITPNWPTQHWYPLITQLHQIQQPQQFRLKGWSMTAWLLSAKKGKKRE